jgi:hypothetical protein
LHHTHAGFSAFENENQARKVARRYPILGSYIARIELDDEGPLRAEQTTVQRAHYTLYGPPDSFLAAVRTVVAV